MPDMVRARRGQSSLGALTVGNVQWILWEGSDNMHSWHDCTEAKPSKWTLFKLSEKAQKMWKSYSDCTGTVTCWKSFELDIEIIGGGT